MKNFYEEIHPHCIGLPCMDTRRLNEQFGWPIEGLLRKCLEINPTERFSMKDVLRYLLRHVGSHHSSPLARYKADFESDLSTIL